MSELETSKTLKVFISYSRADMAFADELVDALDFHGGFDVTIDRHSIIEGEDWKKRLGALIADADTIVFILSPSSAQSDICAWEVEEAYRLSKRILPVRIEATGDCPVPPLLAALNYVRFDPHDDGKPRSFMAGLRALIQALQTDVDWLREHTRLLARAIEWDTAGRPENRLLFSADIASAKNWAATRPKDAPEVTELHMEFTRASEQAEEERTNEEHKKLEEIAAAQSAREEALKEAELSQISRARTVRRTYIGVAALVLIAAFAGPSLYQTVVDQRAIDAEASRTDLRGQIVTFAGVSHGGDDPYGTMSPYTNDLLNALSNKESSILSALSNVNRLTLQRFENAELPFISTSMNGDIYLWNQPENRYVVAFIFGAGNYPNTVGPLRSPTRDADAIVSLFRKMGLSESKIVHINNPTKSEILGSINNKLLELRNERPAKQNPVFSRGLARITISGSQNSLAIFFWSGHAVNIQGENILIPIPEKRLSPENKSQLPEDIIKSDGIRLSLVSDLLGEYAASVLIMNSPRFHSIFVPRKRNDAPGGTR